MQRHQRKIRKVMRRTSITDWSVLLAACVAVALSVVAGGVPTRSEAGSVAPATQASADLSTQEILTRMAAARKGLNSYTVPIHFDLTVHKGISVSAQLDATRYFQSPDREVLVMKNMPSIAKQFRYIYSGLGTPQTWPDQYEITRLPGQATDQTYVLKGVPKSNPNVSHVLLTITRDTLAPMSAQWFYSNGGTVNMAFQNASVNGNYLMPVMETIDISFPEYKVHAVGHYGDYTINQPIPDAIWQASPQPLPT